MVTWCSDSGESGQESHAAAQCHVAQPSLSQQIQKLEEELGERLFDRLKTGARLTPAVRALHERALRILADLEAERFILMKEGHCLGDQVLDF